MAGRWQGIPGLVALVRELTFGQNPGFALDALIHCSDVLAPEWESVAGIESWSDPPAAASHLHERTT